MLLDKIQIEMTLAMLLDKDEPLYPLIRTTGTIEQSDLAAFPPAKG